MQPGSCAATAPSRYGASNMVSAASSSGSLLGDPVAAAGNDHALHVVGDERTKSTALTNSGNHGIPTPLYKLSRITMQAMASAMSSSCIDSIVSV
jgi:hypothetical protein